MSASFLSHFLNMKVMRETTKTASRIPATTPSKTVKWLCFMWFFLSGTMVRWGASIEGLDGALLDSSHVSDKARHKFPDVLLNRDEKILFHHLQDEKCYLKGKDHPRVAYLTSKLSWFRDCGKGPFSKLFSRFLVQTGKKKYRDSREIISHHKGASVSCKKCGCKNRALGCGLMVSHWFEKLLWDLNVFSNWDVVL